jgi:hypothetical protein
MPKSNLPPHVARLAPCASRVHAFMILPDGRWQDVHRCLTCGLFHVYAPLTKVQEPAS